MYFLCVIFSFRSLRERVSELENVPPPPPDIDINALLSSLKLTGSLRLEIDESAAPSSPPGTRSCTFDIDQAVSPNHSSRWEGRKRIPGFCVVSAHIIFIFLVPLAHHKKSFSELNLSLNSQPPETGFQESLSEDDSTKCLCNF